MSQGIRVVSSGVCACSGSGIGKAFDCALGNLPDAFEKLSTFASPKHHDKFVGIARDFDELKYPKFSHCGKILFAALDEALASVDFSNVDNSRISIYFGTSIGGIFEAENMLSRNLESPQTASWRELRDYECSTIAELAAKKFSFFGECVTYSTACSSSSLALSDACNALVQGDCDVAIVCGADAISRITVNGFGSLLLLSQGRARPFDVNRDGINLGEAGVALVLASEDFVEKISAKPTPVSVLSWACSADAYHPTAPHPEGEGAARAINSALSAADISASEISYYNAHGTGTKGNDISEFSAMRKVFGSMLAPYSSVKHAFGHTLGASGVLNIALTVEAMRRGEMLPNLGFKSSGEEFSNQPIREACKADISNALCVSLGFGGNNSAAVLSLQKGHTKKVSSKRLFVYSNGVVSPFLEGNAQVEMAQLLSNVAPLKKRRWAKLQQIALEASSKALENLNFSVPFERVAVCLGTGMGMVSETVRFIEATLLKNEAEPIPSAFTNSVHNAPSSAVSLMFGFKGLNSAVTSKEISFESSLKQAWREINSGAVDAALVGACDESSVYAENFLSQNARFSDLQAKLADMGSVYFVAREGVQIDSKPVAEILKLHISRFSKCADCERDFVEKFVSEFASGEVEVFVSGVANKYQRALVKDIFVKPCFASVTNIDEFYGRNYSASSFSIKSAVEKLKGTGKLAVSYTLSSAGMRAICIFKVL